MGKYDPEKHHRRSIRLKGYEYSQAGVYFVTIVAEGRVSLFGEIINNEMVLSEAGKMVEKIWQSLCKRFPMVELGEYVVMPNHFHGVIMIVGAGLVPALYDRDANGAGTPAQSCRRGQGPPLRM